MIKIEIKLRNPLARDRASSRILRRRAFWLAGVAALALPIVALAAPVEIPYQFDSGGLISAEEFNENFDAIANAINDNDSRVAALEQLVSDLTGGSAVPSGAVVFFDETECPAGWSELPMLQGRVAVGTVTGGTIGATVGTALDDEGTRQISEVASHSHGAGSLSGSTNSTGAHGHPLSSLPNHTHPISASGEHSHSLRLEAAGNYGTYGVMGTLDNAGGNYTSAPFGGSGGAHSHTMSAAGGHSHTVGSAGSHAHTVSLNGSTASAGVGSVDVTMPYVQLLACVKD